MYDLTDREVELLLSKLDTLSIETRDEEEVAGYAGLMDVIYSSWQEIEITENYVKQMHKILMQHDSRNAWHAGAYKRTSNSVAAFDEAVVQAEILLQHGKGRGVFYTGDGFVGYMYVV